jgi:hypothetical protein
VDELVLDAFVAWLVPLLLPQAAQHKLTATQAIASTDLVFGLLISAALYSFRIPPGHRACLNCTASLKCTASFVSARQCPRQIRA